MTPAEVVAATGKSRLSIDKMLSRMVETREVIRVARGKYVPSSKQDIIGQNPGQIGQIVRNSEEPVVFGQNLPGESDCV